METIDKTKNTKSLTITSLNEEVLSFLPVITNKKTDELLVLNCFGEMNSDQESCLIRDIILAVYSERVEEVYIIVEEDYKPYSITEDILLSKHSVSKTALKTIRPNQIDEKSVTDWLNGTRSVTETIRNNLEMIRNHPLLPNSVSVNGFIVNIETSQFSVVD
ncbi:hypothetical protein [Bacillus suaedae]|uniref:Carbonic anhydrase n=1 Tax=Halalkalibacter suaedae TaxID=2822140 RepID=A0A940WWC6_9BACI|nr:hypothetical protein [Bacillus suaedae]MBP3951543.1 hypothetical protein [Bacillus suaedae]